MDIESAGTHRIDEWCRFGRGTVSEGDEFIVWTLATACCLFRHFVSPRSLAWHCRPLSHHTPIVLGRHRSPQRWVCRPTVMIGALFTLLTRKLGRVVSPKFVSFLLPKQTCSRIRQNSDAVRNSHEFRYTSIQRLRETLRQGVRTGLICWRD